MMPCIDVLLVDDHDFFRSVLRYSLQDCPDVKIVAEVANGDDALVACELYHPQVVLMDLHLAPLDGLTTTAVLTRQQPATHVLILTGIEDHRRAIDAFRVGAAGYLRKDSLTPQNLTAAIRCVANGGIFIDPIVFAVLSATWQTPLPSPAETLLVASLEAEERDLLRCVARGHSNQEIAFHYDLSSKTVANKLSLLFTKIGVNGRVPATHFALRHHLIHPGECL